MQRLQAMCATSDTTRCALLAKNCVQDLNNAGMATLGMGDSAACMAYFVASRALLTEHSQWFPDKDEHWRLLGVTLNNIACAYRR